MVLVGSGLYTLDEWSLGGVEDVGFVPLEEDGGHWDTLAGYNVA